MKRININEFKSIATDVFPSLKGEKIFEPGVEEYDNDNYNTWGKFPLNLKVGKIDDETEGVYKSLGFINKNLLSQSIEDKESFVLTYPTLINVYKNVKKYFLNSTFYSRCKRGEEYIYRKITILEWSNFGPDFVNYDNYERFMKFQDLEKIYAEIPEEVTYESEKYICVVTEKEILDKYFPKGENELITNIRKYQTTVEDIRKNKSYWQSGTNRNYEKPIIPLQLFIETDISDEGILNIYLNNWEKGKTYYNGDCVIFENIVYRLNLTGEAKYVGYKGYYNKEKGLLEFDNKDEHGKYVHWKEVTQEKNIEPNVTFNAPSKLYKFKAPSAFDKNAKKLPFKVVFDKEKEAYYAELPFFIGVPIIEKSKDGNEYVNKITDVSFSQKTFKVGDKYKITFKYVIGGVFQDEGDTESVIKGGISYEDTYDCEYKEKTFIIELIKINEGKEEIEEKTLTLGYHSIKFTDNSKLTFATNSHLNMDELLFKDENLVSIQDLTDNSDIYAERGTYAALERHNVLGEIHTLEDLQNYRNNYFSI